MPKTDDADASDSATQREIESVMRRRLEGQHPDWRPVPWKATSVELGLAPVWQKAEPDAVWKTDSGDVILAEIYARLGALKPGHRRKLAMDALKLIALRAALPPGQQLRCLVVVPEELESSLKGAGWFPIALRLAAEVVPVALLEDERVRLGDASRLQAQGQARTKKAQKPRAD